MRIYKKQIKGVKVTAYNDSGIEWVVQAGDLSEIRYPKNKFTMKHAMESAAGIATVDMGGVE